MKTQKKEEGYQHEMTGWRKYFNVLPNGFIGWRAMSNY
jgi:hypothetical protein